MFARARSSVASAAALLGLAACGSPPERELPCESGTACVWAGTGESGFNADDPTAHRLDSKLSFPMDLTFAPDGRAYIIDYNNARVRRVELDDRLVTVIGTDFEGDGPPEMEDRLPVCNPAGALGTRVALNHPRSATFGPDGKLYVAAWHNHKIRIYDPATDVVTALGDGEGFSGDGGPACMARFRYPDSVAIAGDGTLYVVDQGNVRIREIAASTATIDTIAGVGEVGKAGDDGPAIQAQLGFDTAAVPEPSGAIALSGRTLYLADTLNHRIRRIDLDTGVIDCIAGTGSAGYTGDGGQALDATFHNPVDVALGPDGRLYVADRSNHAIRAIDLATGVVTTVAGGTQCNVATEACADHVPARELGLNQPFGIEFDAAGNLYIADSFNHRIVKVAR